MISRRIDQLCCFTQAIVLNVCVCDRELVELGSWVVGPRGPGQSRARLSREHLHRLIRSEPGVARRVGDRLDLAYADTVLLVRTMSPVVASGMVDMWLARPLGAALPGVLWALVTDPRPEVRELGSDLAHEAMLLGFRALVDDHAPR
jgi:hypothetical protein